MTGDLVAFLTARLDEDEQRARAALEQSADEETRWWFDDATPETPREFHVAAWHPERVLRQVAALRAIVDETFEYEARIDGEWGDCHSAGEIAAGECEGIPLAEISALRHLAAIWADHPDYQQEWKP